MLSHNEPQCEELKNDNSDPIATAKNSGINQRNKHINLKYHFMCECHQQKQAHLVKWQTPDQTADVCAKPLDQMKSEHHRSGLVIGYNDLANLPDEKCCTLTANLI